MAQAGVALQGAQQPTIDIIQHSFFHELVHSGIGFHITLKFEPL